MNSEEMSTNESTLEISNSGSESQAEASSSSVSESSSAFSVLLSVAEQMEPIPIPDTRKPIDRFPLSIGGKEVGGFPKNYGYQVVAPVNNFQPNFDHSIQNGAGVHDVTKRGPSKGYHVSLSSAVPPQKMSVASNGMSSTSSGMFYANALIDQMNSHKKTDSQILGRNIMHNSKHMLKTFSKHSGYISTKLPPPSTAMDTSPTVSLSQQMTNINEHHNNQPYTNVNINNNNSNNNNISSSNSNHHNHNTTTSNNNIRSNAISDNHINDSVTLQDNHSSAEDMDDEDDPRRKRKRELSRASHARMRQQIDNKLSRVVSLLRIYREKNSKEQGDTSHHPEIP